MKKIAPISAIALTALLGGAGMASATEPVPVIAVDVPANSGAFAATDIYCRDQGDKKHPYLNIAPTATRPFSQVRYTMKDGRKLGLFEVIIPDSGGDDNYFTKAHVSVQIKDSTILDGHKGLTIYCANSPAAAGQKWA